VQEHLYGCLVFPVFDVEGNIVTLYGRYAGHPERSLSRACRGGRRAVASEKRHVFLPRRATGLWNVGIIKTYSEIILVESVLDALSVEIAGHPNVLAIQGTNGLRDKDLALFKEHGVEKITLILDGDEAGRKAAGQLKKKISVDFEVEVKAFSADHDPNSFLMEHGAPKLAEFLSSTSTQVEPEQTAAQRSLSQPNGSHMRASPSASLRTSGEPVPAQASPHGGPPPDSSSLSVTYGLRRYQILGLEKGPRKLRATVRVEHNGKLHVDTLDFYSARSRRVLAQDLCRLFEETPETIDADITRLIQLCEKHDAKKSAEAACAAPVVVGQEKQQAVDFGQSPNLIERILADFETCGLVGEEPNKLLCYLALSSRKMAEPLAMLILSSSGAGKTALQDAALAFCPPEDLVKLTSLSGKALFYKEQMSLKHKVLALEEGDGAEEASYAIRNLISAGALVIEATIKDLATGRLTTMENRVEGPTSVFITTTNPDTDPETRSRFFITGIDESSEQTRAILAFQRSRQMLDGLHGSHEVHAIVHRHQNFQRLLKPYPVVNPYADQLTYGDDRLQGRRDQPKYLNLIKAVAFLRQMTKQPRRLGMNGSSFEYVEADLEDIRIANELAHEILGRSLDELSRPGRMLLMLVDTLVEKRVCRKSSSATMLGRTDITFCRRDVREFTGWTNYRVHTHMKELVELEYVLVESGRNGMPYRYRLAYEGQGKDGSRFMLGLKDVEQLTQPSQ
jgi:5S rRNA maturation endonuclease (ribonuclease M5)